MRLLCFHDPQDTNLISYHELTWADLICHRLTIKKKKASNISLYQYLRKVLSNMHKILNLREKNSF